MLLLYGPHTAEDPGNCRPGKMIVFCFIPPMLYLEFSFYNDGLNVETCSSASGQQPGLVSTDAGDVSGGNGRRRGTERDEDITGQTGSDDEGGDDSDHAADGAERAGTNTHTLTTTRCRW